MLKIPTKTAFHKSAEHQNLPQTKLYLKIPAGYTLIPDLIRFQKTDSAYIQATEFPDANFFDGKKSLLKALDSIETNHTKLTQKNEFSIGPYKALFYRGNDTRPGLEQLIIMFGDESFTAMITGIAPIENEVIRQEIFNAMLSVYYDKATEVKYDKNDIYEVDLLESNLKLAYNMSQLSIYTLNDEKPLNNPTTDQVMIMTLPGMNSFDQIQQYSRSMLDRFKNNRINITTVKEATIAINGLKSHEIIFEGDFNGKTLKCYQVVLANQNHTVVFNGVTYTNNKELFEQFKRIAQTIKIK